MWTQQDIDDVCKKAHVALVREIEEKKFEGKPDAIF